MSSKYITFGHEVIKEQIKTTALIFPIMNNRICRQSKSMIVC